MIWKWFWLWCILYVLPTEKIHGKWAGQCWCDGGKEERGDEEYDLRSLYIWWWCWRWCWWRLINCDDGGKSMPNRLCLDHFSITHFYRRSQVCWMVTMTMIHWSIRPWQCLSIPLSYPIRYGTYRCSSFDMLHPPIVSYPEIRSVHSAGILHRRAAKP